MGFKKTRELPVKECLEFADYSFEEHFGRNIASYPPRPVLYDYIKGRAEQWGQRNFVQFNTAVDSVAFDEATKTFSVDGAPLRITQGTETWRARSWTVDNLRERFVKNRIYTRAAKMLVADGTLITFANAHFYPEGKYNVVATRLFEDRAVINTTDKCLRPVSGGADIPFDAPQPTEVLARLRDGRAALVRAGLGRRLRRPVVTGVATTCINHHVQRAALSGARGRRRARRTRRRATQRRRRSAGRRRW